MDKKAEQLRELTDSELLNRLRELKDKNFFLQGERYFCGSSGNFRKKGELQKVKKEIAQIQTILHLRQVKK